MDPFILVKFSKSNSQSGDPLASAVIFEWNDEEFIGQYRFEDSEVCLLVARVNKIGILTNEPSSRKLSAMRPMWKRSCAPKSRSARSS